MSLQPSARASNFVDYNSSSTSTRASFFHSVVLLLGDLKYLRK